MLKITSSKAFRCPPLCAIRSDQDIIESIYNCWGIWTPHQMATRVHKSLNWLQPTKRWSMDLTRDERMDRGTGWNRYRNPREPVGPGPESYFCGFLEPETGRNQNWYNRNRMMLFFKDRFQHLKTRKPTGRTVGPVRFLILAEAGSRVRFRPVRSFCPSLA